MVSFRLLQKQRRQFNRGGLAGKKHLFKIVKIIIIILLTFKYLLCDFKICKMAKTISLNCLGVSRVLSRQPSKTFHFLDG